MYELGQHGAALLDLDFEARHDEAANIREANSLQPREYRTNPKIPVGGEHSHGSELYNRRLGTGEESGIEVARLGCRSVFIGANEEILVVARGPSRPDVQRPFYLESKCADIVPEEKRRESCGGQWYSARLDGF